MSIALTQRVKDLEAGRNEDKARLAALESRIAALEERQNPATYMEPKEQSQVVSSKPGLCPKCGKAPGYYFHVKHCRGNAAVA